MKHLPLPNAHWIDRSAVLKCGQTETEWEGWKVHFTKPGWYAYVGENMIVRVGDGNEVEFELCQKCKPLPEPPRLPETVKELLEGEHLYEMCVRVLEATSLETVNPGQVRVLEAAMRKELLPPPPPPGSWKAVEDSLFRHGTYWVRFYDEDDAACPPDLADKRCAEVAAKLNAAELDQVRWKQVADAIDALGAMEQKTPGRATALLQVDMLVRNYKDWRRKEAS